MVIGLARSACVTGVLLALAGVSLHAQAAPDDYDTCIGQRYDRLRGEAEIAATIDSCTRAIARGLSGEPRARALYFRGLNAFLDATRIAIVAMTPLQSAGDPARLRIAAALDDLAACIAAAPQPSPFPFSLRATIYTALERYDEALPDLARAIEIDPRNATHFAQRALIHERLDHFAEARADFDAAIARDPANQNALISRARLWTRYGDAERAAADYDRAIRATGGQTWEALSGRARLAVTLGDPQHAFADWRRAAEIAPQPMLAAQFQVRAGNLARDYLKEPDKAEDAYARALAIMPGYPDAWIQRGVAAERSGRLDDAQRAYEQAMAVSTGTPLAAATRDHARFRIEILRLRRARKAGDPPLPANVQVLARSTAGARRIALVIGNAGYARVPRLLNADRDAESVGAAISEAGFARVTIATDLDRQQFGAVLQEFSEDAKAADWAVIYYAGHGIETGGVNWAIPVDADLDALRDTPARAISMPQLLAAVEPARQLHLVVMDACRDDPFVQQAHRTARGTSAAGLDAALAGRREIGGGLAAVVPARPDTMVLFSTQPGQVTLDGDDLNSPFTLAFLKNLPTPGLSLAQFFDRVRNDVATQTQNRQRPALSGTISGANRPAFFPAR